MKRNLIFLIAGLLLLGFRAKTDAAELRVCSLGCDYTTLQSAIDAAQDGDTVLTGAGTYNENINFGGKNIKVLGKGGAKSCIIDGNSKGSVVTFNSGEKSAVLDGFTIKGGKSSDFNAGGGITIKNSSPIIQNCLIVNNSAQNGGAVYNESLFILKNCTVSGNKALGSGGAVFSRRGLGVIINSTIAGNLSSQGGAIRGGGNIELINSIVRGNVSLNSPYEIYIDNGDFKAVNSNLDFAGLKSANPDSKITYSGSINSDPLFKYPVSAKSAPTASGDYHIMKGSPCIDSGIYTADVSNRDIDGDPRPVNGRWDIGSDEYNSLENITTGQSLSSSLGGIIIENYGSPATPVKIMPLGDSITQSVWTEYSWRYPLWKKLLDGNYSFDYVGTMNANAWGPADWPPYLGYTFDPDHEGHYGIYTEEVLAAIDGWLATYTPDVALVHIGTNDVIHGQENESTISEVSTLIDKLRGDNPKIIILLAQIIAVVDANTDIKVSDYNSRLAVLANEKTTAGSPVIIVDQHTGFDPRTDTYDGLHPNENGEEKMAQKWYDALAPVLDAIQIAPLGPDGLAATAPSNRQVNLTWSDNSECEDGYVIERKLSYGGTYSQIASLGPNTTTYSDNSNFMAGALYYYRVRAHDFGLYSPYTNEAEVTIPGGVGCIYPNVCSSCVYTTIQAAINGGVNDICADNGTYAESLNIPSGRTINIASINGKNYSTITGSNLYRQFKLNSGANLTVNGFTIKDGNSKALDYGGGAVYMLGSSNINVINCDFIHNTNTSGKLGGAIYAASGCQVNIQNCNFTNNIAASSGGVLYAKGATVTMTDCSITSNRSLKNGGVFCLELAANLTVSNCCINRNSAAVSGGMLSASGAAASFNGSNISSNSCGSGYGGVCFLALASSLSLDSCAFTANVCPLQSGGVIYSANSRVSSIQNCLFDDNRGYRTAGAIFISSATGDTLITSSVFSNNRTTYAATGTGGAIQYQGGKKLRIERSSFLKNYTKQNGGAIYAAIGNSTLEIADSLLDSNYTLAYDGGAVYMLGTTTGSLTIQNSTVKNNTARSGAALYYKTGKFTVQDTEFNNNKSILPATGDGGTIFLASTTGSIIERCTFTESNARYGAGIYSSVNNGFRISDCLFENNVAGAAGSITGRGGAVYFSNGSNTVEDCVVTNNSATNIGGAFYGYLGALNISNTQFSANTVTNPAAYDGGTLYLSGTKYSNITGSSISGSRARWGGAIYAVNNTALNITNTVFENNAAGASGSINGQGGAVFYSGGTNLLTDCEFNSNSATFIGGAVYEASGKLTVSGCQFTDNILTNPSSYDGGAIYIKSTSSSLIDRCAISGSTARYGGGLYAGANTSLRVTNSLFFGNSATLMGGAINFAGGSNTVINSTFCDNSAPSGGAIYNSAVANTKIYNSILYFNTGMNPVNDIATLTLTDALLDGTCAGCNTLTRVAGSDPLFVDRLAGDYHINYDSPAKDTGTYVTETPALDIDGQARPNGNWDLGADEYN